MKKLKTKISMPYILMLFILSCSQNQQLEMPNQNPLNTEYFELHDHEGTTNFEVVSVTQKEYKASYIHFDKKQKYLYVNSYEESLDPNIFKCYRVNYDGKIIDTNGVHSYLPDGTITSHRYYQNWIIDDDKTKRKYYLPINEAEKQNYEDWLIRFKELYARAEMVYKKTGYSHYLMRMDDRVFWVWSNHKEFWHEEENYPNKGEKRMIKLPDLTPDFLSRQERLENTSLMEYVTYEEVESEPGEGLNPIGFSGGYHYINLYMPGGDTIKFKRYGSMGVNIQTYKIPTEYGGRDDVVFIVQEKNPNPALVNGREWGGMYVVRPRGSAGK